MPVLRYDKDLDVQAKITIEDDIILLGTKSLIRSLSQFLPLQTSTNYVDITGEPQFVRKVIDAYHSEATEKGIKIVPCCGFDCIPSDLGCQMMVDEMKKRGLEPKEVRLLVEKVKGAASGGTVASIINFLESSSLKELGDYGNPFCLAPRKNSGEIMQPTDAEVMEKGSDSNMAGYDDVAKCYTMPYIMQGKG